MFSTCKFFVNGFGLMFTTHKHHYMQGIFPSDARLVMQPFLFVLGFSFLQSEQIMEFGELTCQ